MKEDIRVIQLSDLHFTSNPDLKLYNRVKKAIYSKKRPPDIIIVSGDIVDNENLKTNKSKLQTAFVKARIFLTDLCNDFKLDPEKRLFVVPGNHDFRLLGNFNSTVSHELFDKIFKSYFESRYIDELGLIIGCFNSNCTDSKINLATGEVLDKEFEKFERFLIEKKEEVSSDEFPDEFQSAKRVALLHHHPMPVRRSEYKKNISLLRFILFKESTDQEKFLILNNSATFMTEMVRNKFSLICHGHKHHRGLSKAVFPIDENYFKNIAVISAGSIGKPTEEGVLSFNIIDMLDNGQINVNFQVKEGAGGYYTSPDSTEVFDKQEIRLNRFEILKNSASWTTKKSIFSDKISTRSGDWTRYNLNKKLIPSQGTGEKIKSEITCASGLFTIRPKMRIANSQDIYADWKSEEQEDPNIQKGAFILDPETNEERSIDAEILIEIPNAVSFTKEQRKGFIEKIKMPGKKALTDKEDRIFWEFTNILPERLVWIIEFPDDFRPKNIRVRVTDLEGRIDKAEQEYCRKNFHYLWEGNKALMSIDYLIPERYYGIVWNLESERVNKKRSLSPKELNEFECIRKYLLNLKKKDSLKNKKFGKLLNKIYGEITNCEILSWEDVKKDKKELKQQNKEEGEQQNKQKEEQKDEKKDKRNEKRKNKYKGVPLEIAISAFDEENSKIKYVGFYCPKCADQIKSCIWKHSTGIGHPITGYVFKSKEACFNPFPYEPDEVTKGILRKPACVSDKNEEVKNEKDYLKSFFAIPLFYPVKSDHVIAVLEFATCSRHNLLYELNEGEDAEIYAKRQIYCYLANKIFGDFISKNEKILFN
jgi:UDP-2,3-diacylglucosamine pyrophosphatase LpxH